MHAYRRNSLGRVLFVEWREIKENFEGLLKTLTKKLYSMEPWILHGVLNVTQFCNSHYMTYIVNGTNTEKSVKTPESAISLKRRWKDDNIERGTIGDQIDCDNSQRELIMETSEVSDKGERIKEIDFIECVRSMAQIFYTREKKEKKVPVYDWKLLQLELESIDIGLKPFLNLLEKLINPSGKGLKDHTISQRQKGLSFLCYFLAGIGMDILRLV